MPPEHHLTTMAVAGRPPCPHLPAKSHCKSLTILLGRVFARVLLSSAKTLLEWATDQAAVGVRSVANRRTDYCFATLARFFCSQGNFVLKEVRQRPAQTPSTYRATLARCFDAKECRWSSMTLGALHQYPRGGLGPLDVNFRQLRTQPSASCATKREGHRSRRSGPAGQHRRWGRERRRVSQSQVLYNRRSDPHH